MPAGYTFLQNQLLEVLHSEIVGSERNILIFGPTGAGKEHLARRLAKRRWEYFSEEAKKGRKMPKSEEFVAINVAAYDDTFLYTELFGYEKGAYTGSDGTEGPGVFERAGVGTVFLDEIGELPVHAQVRLLRALENRVVKRLGPTGREVEVRCMVVAATNANIDDEKIFRPDLKMRFHRRIELPGIEYYGDDMYNVVRDLINDCNASVPLDEQVQEATALWLLARPPEKYSDGNFRELRNDVRREVHWLRESRGTGDGARRLAEQGYENIPVVGDSPSIKSFLASLQRYREQYRVTLLALGEEIRTTDWELIQNIAERHEELGNQERKLLRRISREKSGESQAVSTPQVLNQLSEFMAEADLGETLFGDRSLWEDYISPALRQALAPICDEFGKLYGDLDSFPDRKSFLAAISRSYGAYFQAVGLNVPVRIELINADSVAALREKFPWHCSFYMIAFLTSALMYKLEAIYTGSENLERQARVSRDYILQLKKENSQTRASGDEEEGGESVANSIQPSTLQVVEPLEVVKQRYIRGAYETMGRDKRKAETALGISRNTLNRYLHGLGEAEPSIG